MTRVVVALDRPRGAQIAAGLDREGLEVFAVLGAATVSDALEDRLPRAEAEAALAALQAADVLVLQVDERSLSARVVAACDRLGVRIVPLALPADDRLPGVFGLPAPLGLDASAEDIADAVARRAPAAPAPGGPQAGPGEAVSAPSVIAVWGPAGSPGRSTLAVELAMELSRGDRRVALVDADTHAPSIALALGIPDEGPGFAAACRQVERGELDPTELARISARLTAGVDVLVGINRPSRWPELSEPRVEAALGVCRRWVDYTVVDVAAPLERDEEIMSDLDGPRRNGATLGALRAADLVVAVLSADPVGVARFVRGFSELRGVIGPAPVVVVANRLRPTALGLDARGQVRRTLERFAGVREVAFVPLDPRTTDAALLASSPVAEVAPRSALTLAVRRLVGEQLVPRLGGAPRTPDAADRADRPRRPRRRARDAEPVA